MAQIRAGTNNPGQDFRKAAGVHQQPLPFGSDQGAHQQPMSGFQKGTDVRAVATSGCDLEAVMAQIRACTNNPGQDFRKAAGVHQQPLPGFPEDS